MVFKRFFYLVLFSLFSWSSYGQTSLAFEFQLYPTGIIAGLSFDKMLSEKDQIYGRIASNIFDHRGLGVQEQETGSGLGFSLAYKRFFNTEQSKWRIGIKNDFWWNRVDWETGANTGSTKILVIQPSAELSYVINMNNWFIAPSLAFGLEWNVKTNGEPTGEGPTGLIGFQFGRSF